MALVARYPDLYQGHKKKRDYFEGWYFKIADPTECYVFAFIPGILLGKSAKDSHSFIQLIHGEKAFYRYLSFPPTSFQAEKDRFRINIAGNSFSLQHMRLNIEDPDFSVQGMLNFSQLVTWPDTSLNPGSMGFFNYFPGMQCYSQVCALDMELKGSLTVNGKEIDFSGGRGYVEKNWGKAFPSSWIWLQSNHFSLPRISFTCSLAQVPFLFSGVSFRGFLVGLFCNERFFSFTTLNRSRCRVKKKDADVMMELRNSQYSLLIEVRTNENQFIELHGPREGLMVPLVKENLFGRIKLELKENSGKQLFSGEGNCAGVEYGGRSMLTLDV